MPPKAENKQLKLVVKRAFDIYDADGSGNLDGDELRNLQQDICNAFDQPELTEEQYIQALDILDEDRDGDISYQELLQNMDTINEILNETGHKDDDEDDENQYRKNPNFIKGLGKQIRQVEKFGRKKDPGKDKKDRSVDKSPEKLEPDLEAIQKKAIESSGCKEFRQFDTLINEKKVKDVKINSEMIVNDDVSDTSRPDLSCEENNHQKYYTSRTNKNKPQNDDLMQKQVSEYPVIGSLNSSDNGKDKDQKNSSASSINKSVQKNRKESIPGISPSSKEFKKKVELAETSPDNQKYGRNFSQKCNKAIGSYGFQKVTSRNNIIKKNPFSINRKVNSGNLRSDQFEISNCLANPDEILLNYLNGVQLDVLNGNSEQDNQIHRKKQMIYLAQQEKSDFFKEQMPDEYYSLVNYVKDQRDIFQSLIVTIDNFMTNSNRFIQLAQTERDKQGVSNNTYGNNKSIHNFRDYLNHHIDSDNNSPYLKDKKKLQNSSTVSKQPTPLTHIYVPGNSNQNSPMKNSNSIIAMNFTPKTGTSFEKLRKNYNMYGEFLNNNNSEKPLPDLEGNSSSSNHARIKGDEFRASKAQDKIQSLFRNKPAGVVNRSKNLNKSSNIYMQNKKADITGNNFFNHCHNYELKTPKAKMDSIPNLSKTNSSINGGNLLKSSNFRDKPIQNYTSGVFPQYMQLQPHTPNRVAVNKTIGYLMKDGGSSAPNIKAQNFDGVIPNAHNYFENPFRKTSIHEKFANRLEKTKGH